mgnify:CR=1 FL=1
MTKGTVVIIAVVHWHFTWQSQHNMAHELAERGYRVLFVEPLPKRWPQLSEYNRVWGRLSGNNVAAGLCEQPLVPGVELFSPRLLPDTNDFVRKINQRFFIPTIVDNLKQHIEGPLIVINYLPTAASIALMEALEPDAKFYHCITDWSNDPFAPAYELEAKLAAAVDMVWADSPINIARTSKLSNNVIPMPHGVDVELFAKARKSSTNQVPERPLCAYFGTIRDGLDFDLLRQVSRRFPLRLIGPVRTSLHGLAPETEIVGPVSQQRVPGLLHDVDVLLLPYKHTELNKSVMPAKLFECLATGKPAIVSGLGTLYDYERLFYIRESHDEFLNAITDCLHELPEIKEARIKCAEAHSYSSRTTKIEGYFQQVLNKSLVVGAK